MSLLLDALKKAAQEKQIADSASNNAESAAVLSLEQEPGLVLRERENRLEEARVDEETNLVLDDETLSLSGDFDSEQPAENEQLSNHNFQQQRITPTPSTVTDEALQLLIHKTNQEHKKTRRMAWAGVVVGSLFLLSISGMYFYSNMVDEIESMQRKQQIALATLKSKTKIEENLTSLAVVHESGKQSKSAVDSATEASRSTNKSVNSTVKPTATQQAGKTFSVQRTFVTKL